MARKKVKLTWIANDATRRTTMKKRRKGLLKKVHELSVLCGVEACAIVYGGPNDRFPVDTWPGDPAAVVRVLAQFKGMPEGEQRRKMVNQESFLRQRVAKMRDQQRRQLRENRQADLFALVAEGLSGRRSGFGDLAGVEDVASLTWMLDAKFKSVYDQMERLLQYYSAAAPEGGMLQAPSVDDHQTATAAAAAAMEVLNRHETNLLQPADSAMIGSWAELQAPYLDPYVESSIVADPWHDPFYPF